MKIVSVTDEAIKFDNGSEITFDHLPDCCEWNYADFTQLDSIARITEFDEPLVFERSDDLGFRFGNPGRMFFVPCYSEQNGYYSDEVDIYLDGRLVLDHVEGEMKY